MQDRAILNAVESPHAQGKDRSVFALTANVRRVNACQIVIRIAVVERSSVLQNVEIQTASVGLTASAHLVNVPQSVRRDVVTRD